MTALAGHDLVIIVIAFLIGLIVGWWLFTALRRGRAAARQAPAERTAAPVEAPIAPPPPEEPVEVAPPIGPPDDLRKLKGVGPKLALLLNEQGITRFDQLAALSGAQAERIDESLGTFKGRLARDRVIEQAAYLARGDTEGFEAKFGKLGGA